MKMDFSKLSVESPFTLALTPALSPGERVSKVTTPDNFPILGAVTDFVSSAVRHTVTQPVARLKTRRTIPPLLGERAGVRAGVNSQPTFVTLLREEGTR